MKPVPPGKYEVQPRESPFEIGDDFFNLARRRNYRPSSSNHR